MSLPDDKRYQATTFSAGRFSVSRELADAIDARPLPTTPGHWRTEFERAELEYENARIRRTAKVTGVLLGLVIAIQLATVVGVLSR